MTLSRNVLADGTLQSALEGEEDHRGAIEREGEKIGKSGGIGVQKTWLVML